MALVKYYLFGPPRIEQAGETREPSLNKVKALLAYLLITARPHSREALATMFWPESDGSSARASLRRTLYRLQQEVGEELLLTTGETIGRNPEAEVWVDVEAFEEQAGLGLAAGAAEQGALLEEAAALYSDDFLAGFTLPDCPQFDEWQFFKREELRRGLRQVLVMLAGRYQEQGAWEPAIDNVRRWLVLDSLHEPAHRQLMQLYAVAGRRAAALRQYEACVRLLDEELGVEPEAETTTLYERIRRREVGPAKAPQLEIAPSRRKGPMHNLPAQPTSFVGRKRELAEVRGLLDDGGCRLLTVAGLGGIGKTRLAIEAAAGMRESFEDGVYFVDLEPVETEAYLLPAVAEALNYSLSGQEDPLLQLQRFLRQRKLLLVLDNFEGVVENAPLLTRLLEAGPGVKLLVTSREALRLQEEWLYPLEGLAVSAKRDGNERADRDPAASADAGASQDAVASGDVVASGDAVQLFSERARRARASFRLEEEAEAVLAVCQLVEGMPLAIELAASWLSHLKTADVLDEIRNNLDFLSTSLRNVPARQRSLRAVLEHSWGRLTEAERTLFARLSVFRGGFRREAAEEVTGATLPLLTRLVNKALLRWNVDGRYQIHELLRQFGEEQLEQAPRAAEAAREAHAAYFSRYLAERAERIQGHRQQEADAEITADLDNIRLAWQWVVEQGDVEKQIAALPALDMAFHHQSRYLEGARTFGMALEQLEGRPAADRAGERAQLLLALLRGNYGWLCLRLGQLEQARMLLEQSQAFFETTGQRLLPGLGGDPRLGLSALAVTQGDYGAAQQLAHVVRDQARAENNPLNWLLASYYVADAALSAGDYETAQQYAQEAHDLTEETGDRWFLAYCLNQLGLIAGARGDLTGAARHFRESYALREQFADAEGMAVALNHLGMAALQQEAYEEAADLYRRSIGLYENMGDRGGMATARRGLAQAALALGEEETARMAFGEALQVAAEMMFTPLVLALLVDIGEGFVGAGRAEAALPLLALAVDHPAAEHETRLRAKAQAKRWGGALPSSAGQGREAVSETALADAVALATRELAAGAIVRPAGSDSSEERGRAAPVVGGAQQRELVEPLTERELDVLRLLAEGLTNREIAETLTVVVGTVKAHNNHIYGKLGVRNRTEAVKRAHELSLI